MTQTLEKEELLAKIHEAQFRICSPKEESYIVVGGTKEGKSTLAKLLAGHNLVVFKKEDTGEIAIKAPDEEENYFPLIGHDNLQSETKIPYQVVLSEKRSIWDPPGFSDLGNIDQVLLNGFYIQTLLDNAVKVKFIFVSSQSSIKSPGGKMLIENLTNFADSFKDISFLKESISICVTQIEDKDLSVDNIKSQLKNILNSLDQDN